MLLGLPHFLCFSHRAEEATREVDQQPWRFFCLQEADMRNHENRAMKKHVISTNQHLFEWC